MLGSHCNYHAEALYPGLVHVFVEAVLKGCCPQKVIQETLGVSWPSKSKLLPAAWAYWLQSQAISDGNMMIMMMMMMMMMVIYILWCSVCVCVCLSRKIITSSWESPVTTWTTHNHPVQLWISFDGVCRQNANRRKCQPKVGILSGLFIVVDILSVPIFGWHFVWTISTCFGILSEPWKMSSFEWVWVRLCTVSRFHPILIFLKKPI